MQFNIGDPCYGQLTAVKSRYQYHMTISRAQVGTHRGKVLFEVGRIAGYGFSLDRGLKCFPKLLEQAKQPLLRF